MKTVAPHSRRKPMAHGAFSVSVQSVVQSSWLSKPPEKTKWLLLGLGIAPRMVLSNAIPFRHSTSV